MTETLLYVALDGDDKNENLDTVDEFGNVEGNFGYKINQDHAMMWGERYIQDIGLDNRPVFVDIKMNNGPRTMANIIGWLSQLGVRHTNVWAFGDSNIGKTMERVKKHLGDTRTEVLANLFYTRWKEDYAQRIMRRSLPEAISSLAQLAVENGCDGIILPGNQLEVVAGLETVKASPAIRMPGVEIEGDEQEQASTPEEAIYGGADILVVGSPIIKAPEPVVALESFLAEIRRAEKLQNLKN